MHLKSKMKMKNLTKVLDGLFILKTHITMHTIKGVKHYKRMNNSKKRKKNNSNKRTMESYQNKL
jgi:hypothetical protein